MNKPEYIIVHHSASEDNPKLKDWDTIRAYHKSLGWADIGYHFGIEFVNNSPGIRFGRPVYEIGAHTIGFNQKSIGICVVGNYDDQKLEMHTKFLLVELAAQLIYLFNLPFEHVLGHSETYAIRGLETGKSCPGKYIDMNELRQAIKFRTAMIYL